MHATSDEKTILPAFLLSLFGGLLGFHRFYAGKVGTGVLMALLTFTVFGMLVYVLCNLIEMEMIVSGKFDDANGLTIKNFK